MKDIILKSPLAGKLIPLGKVKDPGFATMGRGMGVEAPEGKVYSPFDGEVMVMFPTGHAVALKSDDGVELLVHVGINTVDLNEGDSVYFDSLYKHSMIALDNKPVKFLDVLNNNGGID